MAPRTTYATLSDGLQPFSLWDQSLADMGLLGTIPCSVSGTNALTLTPLTAAFAPNITAYTNYLTFSFVATATPSGAITAQIGSLGLKNVYLADGVTQATTGNVTLGGLYIVVYSSALNSSAGGFYLQYSAGITANSVNTAAIQNNAVTFAKFQQMAGLSVVGVTGSATSNVGAITGTANQFLGVNSAGNTLAFETMSGDATLTSGVLTVANNAITYAKTATAAQGLTFTRSAKTTNYAILNADKGVNLALGGNTLFAVTLGAASGYDANFSIVITNEDVYTGTGTGRGKTISPNGLSSFILWPGQNAIVYNSNNVWQVIKQNRWKQTSSMGSITLFVDPAGSNTNDGLASGTSNALATLGYALENVAQDLYDMYSQSAPNVAIQLADGTHTGGVHYPGVLVGGSGHATVLIKGNASTPSNVVVQGGIALFDNAIVELQNLKIEDTSVSFCISTDSGAFCRIQGTVVLGATAAGGTQLSATEGGRIIANAGITVSAAPLTGNGYLIYANDFSYINLQNQTITFGASLTYNTVVYAAESSSVIAGNTTWTVGAFTITGQRYQSVNNSMITTFGAGTTVIPGTVAGAGTNQTASPFGLYC